MRRVIPRDGVRSVVKRALVAGVVAGPLLFGTATASAQSYDDKANDVLPCTGECSTHDQDLKGVSVSSSGGQVSFTIEQYGAFTDSTTCRCYFPQLHIYTSSALPAKPDYYTAEWAGGPPFGILRPIALFDRSVSGPTNGPPPNSCPIPGGFNGAGLLVDFGKDLPTSATSVTYSFPLSAIGSPASFGWRIAEPAAGTCQIAGQPGAQPARRAPRHRPCHVRGSRSRLLLRRRQGEARDGEEEAQEGKEIAQESEAERHRRSGPEGEEEGQDRRRRRSRRRIRPSRRPACSAPGNKIGEHWMNRPDRSSRGPRSGAARSPRDRLPPRPRQRVSGRGGSTAASSEPGRSFSRRSGRGLATTRLLSDWSRRCRGLQALPGRRCLWVHRHRPWALRRISGSPLRTASGASQASNRGRYRVPYHRLGDPADCKPNATSSSGRAHWYGVVGGPL